MSTINGSGLATLNRETLSFTPFQGSEYGGRYEGPLAQIVAKYETLVHAGYSVQLESDSSPIASCTFKSAFAGGGVPGGAASSPNADFTDTWSLTRNTVHKELLASDHPSLAILDATNLEELKRFTDNPQLFADEEGFTETTAESTAAATYLWDLWRSGVRSVEVKQPILRLTRTTNPFYDAQFNMSNVDTVLNTSQMVSDSGVPSNFAVPLFELANSLTTLVTRSDSIVVRFGWLKDLCDCTQSGTQRTQYVIEYKFGLWDTVLYNDPG